MKVLLCEPETLQANGYRQSLEERGHEIELAATGKEAQTKLANGAFEVAVINVELSSFSAIEVIKFIRFKNIKVKIVLVARSESMLEEFVFGKQNLKKLGVGEILIHPFTIDKLDAKIKGFFARQSWKGVSARESSKNGQEVELKAFDDQFTSIKIGEFFCGNLAIFDVYIRLSKNKYLKILNQGESMERERLEHYRNEKGVTHLYFKTNDRKMYINFLNELISKLADRENICPQVKFNFSESLTALMAQEVYTKGMNKDTLEETLNVCQNVHKTLESMPSFRTTLEEYLKFEDTSENHIYLTMVYSDVVAQNIGWVTDHSRPKILLGAFLHDIGKLKLPRNLRSKKMSELSGSSLEEYKKHCAYGVELLDQISEIGEQVKQVVYQHHEMVNGTGFPNGLAGAKIYPLAKIAGFANRMAELTVAMQESPHGVLKKLIQDKDEIFCFDPDVVKAFIKAFSAGAPREQG